MAGCSFLSRRRVRLPVPEQRSPFALPTRPTRVPRTRLRSGRDRCVDAAHDPPLGNPATANADLVKSGRHVVLQRGHDGRIPAGGRASSGRGVGPGAGRSGGRARTVPVHVICRRVDDRSAIDRVLPARLSTTFDHTCTHTRRSTSKSMKKHIEINVGDTTRCRCQTYPQSAVRVCPPWLNDARGRGRPWSWRECPANAPRC